MDFRVLQVLQVLRVLRLIKTPISHFWVQKKRAADCSVALRRGRLPTLPLSQYHRRGEA